MGRAGWSGAASGPVSRLGWSWPSSGSSPAQTARPACTTDRQTDKQTGYSLDCRRRHPGAADKFLLPHHSDSLQVDLGAAQLLPAVVLVALPLGDAAELTCGLKDVLHQRAAAHLVSGDLSRVGGGRNTQRAFWEIFHTAGFLSSPPSGRGQRRGSKATWRPTAGPRTNLWVSGMFWTQNLQPLAVGFTLRVVDVAEEAGRPARQKGRQTVRCQSEDKQTSRQTAVGLRTDRQADRHTAKQTDRLTDRCKTEDRQID